MGVTNTPSRFMLQLSAETDGLTRSISYIRSVLYIFLPHARCKTMGPFFWDYSGYSYSGLGITEYTEFQFSKERSFTLKTEYSWRR